MKFVTMLILAALAVAACGGSSDGDVVASGSSPLEEIFGFGGSASEQQARAEEQNREMEEAIRQCMADQGFEYTPNTENFGFMVRGIEGEDLSDREYAEQYGFGITTIGFDTEESTTIFEPESDPNFERMNQMSESERLAYEKALWGDFTRFDESMSEEEMNEAFAEPTGCQATAAESVFGNFEIFETLTPAFEDMEQRFNADPRVAEFNAEFAECISGQGYQYGDPTEMQEEAFMLMDDVFGSDEFGSDELALAPTPEEVEQMTEEELRDAFPMFAGPGWDEEKLAAAQDEERAMAVAAVECGVSPRTGTSEAILSIRYEYEQALIDENREVFDEFEAQTG